MPICILSMRQLSFSNNLSLRRRLSIAFCMVIFRESFCLLSCLCYSYILTNLQKIALYIVLNKVTPSTSFWNLSFLRTDFYMAVYTPNLTLFLFFSFCDSFFKIAIYITTLSGRRNLSCSYNRFMMVRTFSFSIWDNIAFRMVVLSGGASTFLSSTTIKGVYSKNVVFIYRSVFTSLL